MKAGYFYEPTILVDVRPEMRLVATETFGPTMPIMKVRDLDEAIERANAQEYGLGANIYTRSLEWAMTAMERITAGTFWINDPLTDNDAGPFGGMRKTGHSRELGVEGLDEFRETKHVHEAEEARLQRKDNATEKRVEKIAERLGFKVRFNGDPRGGAIRFLLPSKRSNNGHGETWGISWYQRNPRAGWEPGKGGSEMKERLTKKSWPRQLVDSVETRKRDLVIRIADWTRDKYESV